MLGLASPRPLRTLGLASPRPESIDVVLGMDANKGSSAKAEIYAIEQWVCPYSASI